MVLAREEVTATTCMSNLYPKVLRKNCSSKCILNTQSIDKRRDQRVWTSSRREDVREGREKEIGKTKTKNIVRKTEITQNQLKGKDRDRDRIERGGNHQTLINQKETVLSREETSSTSGTKISIND
jgi:hypothetical protein